MESDRKPTAMTLTAFLLASLPNERLNLRAEDAAFLSLLARIIATTGISRTASISGSAHFASHRCSGGMTDGFMDGKDDRRHGGIRIVMPSLKFLLT
jgi:hypothetical protein